VSLLEKFVPTARLRLASLWLSQVARVLADNCLRMFVVLEVAQVGQRESQSAWYQVTPFFILPFILFAPINGPLTNALPRRWVLAGASAFSLLVALVLGVAVGSGGDPWFWCVGLLAMMMGGALYSPTRYALLPAAAEAAEIPLARVNGWIEMGGAAAVVAGMLLGIQLFDPAARGFPPAVALVAVLYALSALTALPVRFPSDVCRPETVGSALAGFFRDARRIFHEADARASMWGLACFLALVVAGTGAMLATSGALVAGTGKRPLFLALILIGAGTAVGSLIASLQGHPRRCLGLIPFGATGMVLALAWSGITSDLIGPALLLGVMGGLTNVPLRAAYQAAVPADARGNGMTVSNSVNYLLILGAMLFLFTVSRLDLLGPTGQLWLLVGLAALGCGIAWRVLLRESFEQFVEVLFWPCYRVRAHGPGVTRFPSRGPLLVVANHTAWCDPMWVSKVTPRRVFAMMTSDFYDLPGVHFIFANVFRAIRVQASAFRREAPELAQAIAQLDRGEGVSLFPEGWLRRKPEPSLRKFGQGVWHILRERPDTPVVICWIEGGYGSFTSYFQGKPTKNKRMDWWRPIDVGISAPVVVPPDVLADHHATRIYLMRECLKARGHLGLEVPPLPEMDEEEKRQDAPEEGE